MSDADGADEARALKIRENRAKRRAYQAVERAVAHGDLPPPSEQRCSSRGQPAEVYHHHQGYAPESWLDVVPLCKTHHTMGHMADPEERARIGAAVSAAYADPSVRARVGAATRARWADPTRRPWLLAVHQASTPRGERARTAKLTTALVLELRRLAATPEYAGRWSALGRRFGVSHMTARAAVLRKTWAHVGEEDGGG